MMNCCFCANDRKLVLTGLNLSALPLIELHLMEIVLLFSPVAHLSSGVTELAELMHADIFLRSTIYLRGLS